MIKAAHGAGNSREFSLVATLALLVLLPAREAKPALTENARKIVFLPRQGDKTFPARSSDRQAVAYVVWPVRLPFLIANGTSLG